MKLKPLIVALRNNSSNSNSNNNKKNGGPSITEIALDERISFSLTTTATTTTTDNGDNNNNNNNNNQNNENNNNNNKEFKTFLKRLKKNKTITKVLLKTNFLIDLSQEQILHLFDSISLMCKLQEITIQSSSRFHVQMINPIAIKKLKQATYLQTLIVEDMQITAQQHILISALSYVIEDHPKLQKLYLRNFFANDWSNTTQNRVRVCVLDPLLWTIATLPELQVLEFSGCGSHALCGQQQSSDWLLSPKALQNVLLKTNDTLQTLDVSFLELDDVHFNSIANHLKTMNESSKLTNLVLDYHRLGNDGLTNMMESMVKNMTIQKLSLRSLMDIGDIGYQHVMTMLASNYTLRELSVTTSHPNQQAQIDLLLRMNQSGGRRLLRNPNTPLCTWLEVLATTSDDLDVTRHLISEIPGIICNNNSNSNNVSVVPAVVVASVVTASPA